MIATVIHTKEQSAVAWHCAPVTRTVSTAGIHASLALQFLLELAVLGGLGYWGYSAGGSSAARIAVAVAAPSAAAAVWALLGAPRARFHVRGLARLLLEAAFFGAGAVALAAAGRTWLGLALGIAAVANVAILRAADRDG
jgi:hypothetical protein